MEKYHVYTECKSTKIPVVMSSDWSILTACKRKLPIDGNWYLLIWFSAKKNNVIFAHSVNKMWIFSFVLSMCNQATCF